MYLTKEQLKKVIEERPSEISEQQVLEGLVKGGHTFEGIEAMPASLRTKLEPATEANPEVKGLPSIIGGGHIAQGFAQVLSGRAEGLSNAAGTLTQTTNQLIASAKKLPIGDPRRKQLLQQAQQMAANLGNEASSFMGELPTNKQVIGSAAKLATTIGTLGVGAPASAIGRIGVGAGIGAGFGASSAAEANKSTGNIVGEGLVGGLVGAGTAGAIEGIKYAVRGTPKLLAYTSNTPEEVLNRQYDNPSAFAKTFKEVKQIGQEGVLEKTQAATRAMRTNLSKQWEEGANTLIKQNTGARVGLSSSETKLLTKVADEFGIELPQNVSKFSLKEALELNKEINELYSKKFVKEGAAGVIVRKAKDALSGKLSSFAGVKDFLGNYGAEKEVFDAANAITGAYNTANPIKNTTALSRLTSVFNENKPAYLSALKDLEEATGIPFMDYVAGVKNLQIRPNVGKNIIGQLIEVLLMPITSPRSAGFITRQAGRLGQTKASVPLRAGISEGIRRVIRP